MRVGDCNTAEVSANILAHRHRMGDRAIPSMTVTELARRAGVTPHVVRHYVRIGLLVPGCRQDNGYKLFSKRDLNRLHFIRKAQNLGYKLAEIAKILEEADQGRSPCPQVRDIIRKRIEENRRRLDEMLALQERMEEALVTWEKQPDGIPDGHTVCYLIETSGEDCINLNPIVPKSG